MADYTTPGSAVSNTVQQILERRRELERQGLLDQLGVQKYKDDQADQDRDFQLRQLAEQRAGKVADANISADQERLFGEKLQNMPWGRADVTDLEQTDPEFYNELLKRQMIERSQPTVGGRMLSTDENGNPVEQPLEPESAPARSFFRGSSDYQKAEDERARIAALASNPDFTGDDPLKMLLTGAQAGINVPASTLPGKQYIIGPEGRTRQVISGRGMNGVTELNWAPQPNAASQPQLYQVPDGKGGYTSYWLRPGEQPTDRNKIQSQGPIDKGDLPANAGNNDILDRQLLGKLISSNSIRDKKSSQATREQALGALTGMAMQRGVSRAVVEDIGDALTWAQEYTTRTGNPPTVAQIMAGLSSLPPQEQQQAEMIIRQYMAGGR